MAKSRLKTEEYEISPNRTCVVCFSAPVKNPGDPKSIRCGKCAEMNPTLKQMRERREAGMCIGCGVRPPDKSSSTRGFCAQCRRTRDEFTVKFKQSADAEALARESHSTELCYRTGGCQCGGIHVHGKENPDGVEFRDGERSLVRRNGEEGISHLVGIRLSDAKSRAMKFLWPGRIPMGKGMIAQGLPGKGKSTVVLDIAARITKGENFPDGAKNDLGPRTVLWAGTEDDLEDTVKPKLQAIGADMDKMIALKRVCTTEGGLKSRRLLLQKDVKLLYKMLNENPDVAMVIFDPITGFYGGADGNSSKEIRPIMEQLAEVCRNTGVVVVAIMHENRRKDVTALERVLGSGAVGQVFRAGFRFSDDPKNKGGFTMACSKTNFKIKGGLRYTIQDANPIKLDDGTVATEIGKVVWGETHEDSADDVIAQAAEVAEVGFADDSVVGRAVAIMQEALADGLPHPCKEVHAQLDKSKPELDKNARNKARWKLGVKTLGKAPGPWWWQLPKSGVPEGLPGMEAERTITDQEAL